MGAAVIEASSSDVVCHSEASSAVVICHCEASSAEAISHSNVDAIASSRGAGLAMTDRLAGGWQ
jgi:hypothetical protein